MPLAEQQADARLVVGVAELSVHGRVIKIHLAGEFGLEGLHLEVDDDVAAEAQVIKKQVEGVGQKRSGR